VNETTRHKLVWGWLRLFLASAQISLAAIAACTLVVVGMNAVTWALVIAATTATVISRLIYHGRPDPNLEEQKKALDSTR
jgi:hypothetical protein